MGWLDERLDYSPDHEGWIRGCVNRAGVPVEFETPRGAAVPFVRAECSCGWAGPVVPAPVGAHWSPYVVCFADEGDEERLIAPWHVHTDAVVKEERTRAAIRRSDPPTGDGIDRHAARYGR